MTPLTPAQARAFADRWFAAFNSHELATILACYDPAIEHSSPFIKRYNDAVGRGDEPSVKGLKDLGDYFGRALQRNPTLRFDTLHIATGLDSVILVYRRHSHDTPPEGEVSAEVFFLNGAGKIVRSVSHYG
jgi:hypothetical protein